MRDGGRDRDPPVQKPSPRDSLVAPGLLQAGPRTTGAACQDCRWDPSTLTFPFSPFLPPQLCRLPESGRFGAGPRKVPNSLDELGILPPPLARTQDLSPQGQSISA